MSEASRRDYGAGSVFQRSDGRWIGRIEAGWNSAGNRRRIQVSAKTEAECKRRLVKKRREIDETGVPVERLSSTTTVKTWADAWIENRRIDLVPSTHGTYAGAVRKWVVPTIGKKQLASLSPGDLRAVTRAEEAAGNAASSSRQTRRILLKMLRDALVEGHKVPARLFEISAPVASESDRDRIPLDDSIALLNASLQLAHASRWIVSFFEGTRQAETLGLTRDRLDFKRRLITVDRQLAALPYLDRQRGTFQYPAWMKPVHLWKSYHLTPPKTKKGYRVLPMIGPVEAALRQWLEIAPESPHGLVWCRPDGQPINPQADTREWIWLQDQAQVAHVEGTQGRRYDGHEIRHSTATLLLESGTDPKVVEAVLGHSSIATSRGYQHVSQELAREAMEKVADRFAFILPERRPLELDAEPAS